MIWRSPGDHLATTCPDLMMTRLDPATTCSDLAVIVDPVRVNRESA